MTLTLDLTDVRARDALAPARAPRPGLIGLTRDELADALAAVGVPERQRRMRARQLWH